MPVPTQVRVGRRTALLSAFQSAKGVLASNFTASAGGVRLWTDDEAQVPHGPRYHEEGGMETARGPGAAGAWRDPDAPLGRFSTIATPQVVERLLRSNYGPYAAGTFTLEESISGGRWLTLAWVEDVSGTGTQKLVRVRDAWVHRLAFTARGRDHLWATADYAGRRTFDQPLEAGGVTLPPAPMAPGDVRVFPGALVEFRRDPLGVNTPLRFRELRLTFDQGLKLDDGALPWDYSALLCEVVREGPLVASVEIESEFGDETWAILTQARAGVKQHYRFTAVSEGAPSVTLTVDLHGMAFEVDPLGHEGRGVVEYKPFRARAIARVDGSGNFVSVSLS